MSAENKTGKTGGVQETFTLVEILVVLGLMAILLFMALPAFEKIAKGGGVEVAARNLSSKLGAARGYAINNRQYVAVLMPDANLPNDYLFRSYKLCVVSPRAPATNVFDFNRWLPSENWGFLPAGAAINHINNQVHAGNSGTWAAFTCERVDNVKLHEISSSYDDTDNVRAIVFKPNGKLAEASGSSESRYVAVSESTYSGTILVSTNQKNWIDITIDQYTGRVNYGIE